MVPLEGLIVSRGSVICAVVEVLPVQGTSRPCSLVSNSVGRAHTEHDEEPGHTNQQTDDKEHPF